MCVCVYVCLCVCVCVCVGGVSSKLPWDAGRGGVGGVGRLLFETSAETATCLKSNFSSAAWCQAVRYSHTMSVTLLFKNKKHVR